MMDRALFQDLSPEQRLSALKANADRIEMTEYSKSFTADELVEMKEELSDVAIELGNIELAKKKANDEFKEQAKKPSARYAGLIQGLRDKSVNTKEDCFVLVDQEDGEVGFYNSDGVLVFSRPIQPKERQSTLHSQLRKAE